MDEIIYKNRYLPSCRHGLIQLVATNYAPKGYHLWVHRRVRPGKNPLDVDRRIIGDYNLDLSVHQRKRRKQAGVANVKYLRLGDDYLILATKGFHVFLEDNIDKMRHLRTHPLRIFGYSVSLKGELRKPKVHTVIERRKMEEYRGYFSEIATRKSAEALEREINGLPFERYSGVIKNLWELVNLVNKHRRRAGGCKLIEKSKIRTKRRLLRPYEDNQL